jgi:hypothetical protein
MATDYPVLDRTYKAATSLANYQFCAVKFSADNTVTPCTAVTDVAVGINQGTDPANGGAIIRIFGISKAKASTTIAAGNIIGTSTAATLRPITLASGSTYPLGIAESSAHVGEYFSMILGKGFRGA